MFRGDGEIAAFGDDGDDFWMAVVVVDFTCNEGADGDGVTAVTGSTSLGWQS